MDSKLFCLLLISLLIILIFKVESVPINVPENNNVEVTTLSDKPPTVIFYKFKYFLASNNEYLGYRNCIHYVDQGIRKCSCWAWSFFYNREVNVCDENCTVGYCEALH